MYVAYYIDTACDTIPPSYRESLDHKEYEVAQVMMPTQDILVTKVKEDYVALRYTITMTTVK